MDQSGQTIFRLRDEKHRLRSALVTLIERCDALEKEHGLRVSNLDDGALWARVGNAVTSAKDLLKSL